MRIGIYYHARVSRETGGGAVFQETIIDEINRTARGHEVYLFSPTVPEQHSAMPEVRFVQVQSSGRRLIQKAWRARQQIKKGGAAALLENEHAEPGPLERALREHWIDLVWFVSLRTERVSVPYFATVWDLGHRVHPYFPELSSTDWTWGERERHYRSLLPRAARVITGTAAGKEEIVSFYQVPEENVQVVPFPTPEFALAAEAADEEGAGAEQLPERYLFYPAQFWPHKNHVGLLLALKLLREQHDLDFHLVLTGSDKGNRAFVKQRAEELGLADRVLLLGFVETAMLRQLYRRAFALVYPTFLGPDNLPPLEAFALGCPVIASRVSGADEQLGDAALLFDPRAPEQMAARVKELHDSPALREELIGRGRERARRWTAAEYVARVFDIVDDFEAIRRCWGPGSYPR